MSHLSVSNLAARAPAPFLSINPLHTLSRRSDASKADEEAVSKLFRTLECNGTKLSEFKSWGDDPKDLDPLACPSLEIPQLDCEAAHRYTDEERSTWNETRLDEWVKNEKKEHCIPLCNSFHDGSLVETALECQRANCVEADKTKDGFRTLFESVYEFGGWNETCEELGLGSFVPVPGSDTVAGASGSGASGLKMGGMWGRSVVFALVVGSMLSGYLV